MSCPGPQLRAHLAHPQAHLASRCSSFFSWGWPISRRSKAIQLCGSARAAVGTGPPRHHPAPSSAHCPLVCSDRQGWGDNPAGRPGTAAPSAHRGSSQTARVSVRCGCLGGGPCPAAQAPATPLRAGTGDLRAARGLRAGRGPGPGRLAHLALVLRRGREEPRAVLLADVDNLEGEDVVGRGLLGGPHHPEGTAPVVTAWTMPAETAPPLSRSRHPAPCPEEHGTWRRPGAERRAAGVQACTLGAAPCGAASRGRVTSPPVDATLHGHHPPTSGAAWPLRALHQALRTHTPSTALPREHFKEVTHCSCPPGRVRGLHRGREVYRGEACRARQLGQACPRGPSGGPGTRLQCRQAEGGEFGGKKRPCPGDPRNLMDQCLLAARC